MRRAAAKLPTNSPWSTTAGPSCLTDDLEAVRLQKRTGKASSGTRLAWSLALEAQAQPPTSATELSTTDAANGRAMPCLFVGVIPVS